MNTKTKKEASPVTEAVLFTDGSARPVNPGCIGWSVHGYTYSNDSTTKGQGHPTVAPTPTGYVLKETKPELLDIRGYYDYVGWHPGPYSNNAAEILGISQALAYTASIPTLKNVNIYSDSKYAITGATEHVKSWVANDWIKRDGNPVSNQEFWKELLDNMNKVYLNGTKVNITWVKAHADNFGNCVADNNAAIGSEKAQVETERGEKEVHSSPDGHWKNSSRSHKLIGLRGLIFSGEEQHNKPGEYYQLSQVKSDEYIARKAVDASFGYCLVKEPDPLVEMVRSKQISMARTFNTLFLLRMDRLYDKAVSSSLELFGDIVLKQKSSLKCDLTFVNEKLMVQGRDEDKGDDDDKSDKQNKHRKKKSKEIPIVEELYPPMLAYRAITAVSALKGTTEVLKSLYEKDPEVGLKTIRGGNCEVVDVTDQFFDKEKDKKGVEVSVFKKDITVSTQNIFIEKKVFGVNVKFQFVFGIHLPTRGTIKSLEGGDVRIWIVASYESEGAIRYSTVIKSDDDWSAWTAADSNLILSKDPYVLIV